MLIDFSVKAYIGRIPKGMRVKEVVVVSRRRG